MGCIAEGEPEMSNFLISKFLYNCTDDGIQIGLPSTNWRRTALGQRHQAPYQVHRAEKILLPRIPSLKRIGLGLYRQPEWSALRKRKRRCNPHNSNEFQWEKQKQEGREASANSHRWRNGVNMHDRTHRCLL